MKVSAVGPRCKQSDLVRDLHKLVDGTLIFEPEDAADKLSDNVVGCDTGGFAISGLVGDSHCCCWYVVGRLCELVGTCLDSLSMAGRPLGCSKARWGAAKLVDRTEEIQPNGRGELAMRRVAKHLGHSTAYVSTCIDAKAEQRTC